MALVEAVLVYRPHAGDPIPLGKTDDPRVLAALRDCLLEEAAEEVRMWRNIDPGVAAIRTGEFKRLHTILEFFLAGDN